MLQGACLHHGLIDCKNCLGNKDGGLKINEEKKMREHIALFYNFRNILEYKLYIHYINYLITGNRPLLFLGGVDGEGGKVRISKGRDTFFPPQS